MAREEMCSHPKRLLRAVYWESVLSLLLLARYKLSLLLHLQHRPKNALRFMHKELWRMIEEAERWMSMRHG
jgi:hypothetical protein